MAKKSKLRIIPLGGVDGIGRNITAVEYSNEIIIIDCGVSFPEDDMPGINLVIPDIAYLESLPVCERCGEPIQDEHLYLINDEFVCQECLDRDFRKDTNDYVKCF